MTVPPSAQPDTSTTGSRYPQTTRTISGPLLVATDGTKAGEAAFRAASMIAAKSSSSVHVMVVVEPLPVLVPEPSLIIQPLVASPEMLNVVRDRVIAQIRGLAPKGSDWHVDVEYGKPSDEIVNKARARNASVIAIGPKRGVFAVDFSPQSMDAARVGLRLLGDEATVIIAHVRPMVTVYDGMGMWEEEYESAAAKELEKFAEALNAPGGVRVEKVMLSGSPASALLNFAEKEDADLIVAGTRGAGLMQRLLLGSVATRLMRHSTRSLLIVPDSE